MRKLYAFIVFFVLILGYSLMAVQAEVEPLAVTITLDKEAVAVGETVTATWTVTGGEGPYPIPAAGWFVYSAGSSIYNRAIIKRVSDNEFSSSFKPVNGESVHIFIEAEDAAGRTKTVTSSTITVSGSITVEPIDVIINLDKTSVAVGETVTATWTVTGGEGPYPIPAAGWFVNSAGSSIYNRAIIKRVSDNEFSSSFKPLNGESVHIFMEAEDAAGRTKTVTSSTITISGSITVEPIDVIINLDKTSVAVGETVTATWTVTGGEGPYPIPAAGWFVYSVGSLIYNRAIIKRVSDNEFSSSFKPVNGESVHIFMEAEDAAGRIKTVTSSTILINELISSGIAGDATNDVIIDILDLVSIIDYIVSNTNPASFANADANKDNTVDILDLVWIIDRIVGS